MGRSLSLFLLDRKEALRIVRFIFLGDGFPSVQAALWQQKVAFLSKRLKQLGLEAREEELGGTSESVVSSNHVQTVSVWSKARPSPTIPSH